MSSLAPITIGMVGLEFALRADGMPLLGVDAKPASEDGPAQRYRSPPPAA